MEDHSRCVEAAQGLPGLVGGDGAKGCSSQGKGQEIRAFQPGTQRLASPGTVWDKALVVTDVVKDSRWCVEAARGLQGLVGEGGAAYLFLLNCM